ncbi:hypothetical protein [Mobilicoccus caccae]|nr:hypothetical protein [Mobilicoccus caccae]
MPSCTLWEAAAALAARACMRVAMATPAASSAAFGVMSARRRAAVTDAA